MNKIVLVLLALLLSGCSPKQPGVKPPFLIYPYEFYERFNLRTIISSYSEALKYYCASYPKDFFTRDQLTMPDTDTLVLEDESKKLVFELYELDRVIVTEETKDGSYYAKYLYIIYYNEENNDFRTDRFFIPKHEECKTYRRKDANQSAP
ncbi:MAG: hypothetical protein IBX43_04410 [Campylobacterales bacterium]|nr:hypothetical protein [Campylobacterales bacterium]